MPHVSVASLTLNEADTGGCLMSVGNRYTLFVLNVSVCMYVLIMYVYIYRKNKEQCASSPSLLLQDAVRVD